MFQCLTTLSVSKILKQEKWQLLELLRVRLKVMKLTKMDWFVLSKLKVNCKMGMYNNAKTTNLRISDIVVILPLNQLLSREPASIVANPIQSKVIVPWIKLPMIILFVMILTILGCCEMRSTGTLDSPFTIETTIIEDTCESRKDSNKSGRSGSS